MLKTFLSFMLGLLVVFGGHAQALTVNDLTLVTEEYPPFNFEKDGKLQGISVDLLADMLAKVGSDLTEKNIELMPWARGYAMAQDELGTVLFACTRNEAREKLFKWVGPIAPTKIGLVGKKSADFNLNSVQDAFKLNVGVIRDDIGQQILESEGMPLADMQAVAKAELNVKKLAKGRIDVWAYEVSVAKWLIKSSGFDASNFSNLFTLKQGELYYAFHKSTPDEIITKFQSALDELKADGTYQKILDKYLK